MCVLIEKKNTSMKISEKQAIQNWWHTYNFWSEFSDALENNDVNNNEPRLTALTLLRKSYISANIHKVW